MYFETKSQHKSQYSSIKKYDKISRKIIYSGQFFQKFPVGIHKEYDEKGNVTNEVNFEKHYPFTIDNLVIKLLTDFEIDINDTNLQITVNRENHSSPQYRIYVPLTPYPYSDQRIIIISGESGKLISDEIFKSER